MLGLITSKQIKINLKHKINIKITNIKNYKIGYIINKNIINAVAKILQKTMKVLTRK